MEWLGLVTIGLLAIACLGLAVASGNLLRAARYQAEIGAMLELEYERRETYRKKLIEQENKIG